MDEVLMGAWDKKGSSDQDDEEFDRLKVLSHVVSDSTLTSSSVAAYSTLDLSPRSLPLLKPSPPVSVASSLSHAISDPLGLRRLKDVRHDCSALCNRSISDYHEYVFKDEEIPKGGEVQFLEEYERHKFFNPLCHNRLVNYPNSFEYEAEGMVSPSFASFNISQAVGISQKETGHANSVTQVGMHVPLLSLSPHQKIQGILPPSTFHQCDEYAPNLTTNPPFLPDCAFVINHSPVVSNQNAQEVVKCHNLLLLGNGEDCDVVNVGNESLAKLQSIWKRFRT